MIYILGSPYLSGDLYAGIENFLKSENFYPGNLGFFKIWEFYPWDFFFREMGISHQKATTVLGTLS